MSEYYKFLPKIPALPDNLIAELLDYIYKSDLSQLNTSWWAKDEKYQNRRVKINEVEYTSSKGILIDLQPKLLDFIHNNITRDYLKSAAIITDRVSPVWGAHTDTTRRFLILNIIEPGGPNVITRWYQEKDKPVFRFEKPNVTPLDYSNLIELEKVCYPTNRWILMETKVIHDIQNIMSDRIAINVGLFAEDTDRLIDSPIYKVFG